jgi:uncharacterized membrane protein
MAHLDRHTEGRWSDEHVEQLVGNLLRAGVIVAAIVTALGGVALLARHGGARADYRLFVGEPAALRSVAGAVGSALRLEPRGIVQLGLVLLIATPVARVLLSLVAFVLQRDRLYVAVTAVVLSILLFSLLFGGHAG